jgi:hypothetical protein
MCFISSGTTGNPASLLACERVEDAFEADSKDKSNSLSDRHAIIKGSNYSTICLLTV